jgi:serine/threonine-protein kinase
MGRVNGSTSELLHPQPEILSVLDGRVELLSTLGCSAQTLEYLARDKSDSTTSGEAPLLKLEALHPDVPIDSRLAKLFRIEALAASGLSHPNIVRATPPEIAGGLLFRATEYKPCAETLRAILHREGWLDLRRALRMAYQAAAALAAAHASGTLHLRLEPEMVLIDQEDAVVITGFGVGLGGDLEWARRERSRSCAARYLSLEHASGSPMDHRTDLYSIGVLLFEMLTDRVPFDSASEETIKDKVQNQNPFPPHVFRSEVPLEVSKLVTRLLCKNPHQRLAGATELQHALWALLGSAGDTLETDNRVGAVAAPNESQPADLNVIEGAFGENHWDNRMSSKARSGRTTGTIGSIRRLR